MAALLMGLVLILAVLSSLLSMNCNRMLNQAMSPPADLPQAASIESRSIRTCAPWLKERKVLFLDIATMEDYHNPNATYKGGEHYCTASMEWALTSLGFQVDKMRIRKAIRNTPTTYHRIVYNSALSAGAFPGIECRLRPFMYFPGNTFPKSGYHDRQILTAYSDGRHTFGGYFIHHLVLPDAKENSNTAPVLDSSHQHGLLLGKVPVHFVQQEHVIAALLEAGFTLHSTCTLCVEEKTLPSSVVNHGMLSPAAFDILVKQCSFVLGVGHPPWSPTPFVAVSLGTAFLNPVTPYLLGQPTVLHRNARFKTQNNAIALLGRPYVYNYRNVTEAVQFAKEACSTPFEPYVPYELRPEAMLARMCSLVEDDSLCRGTVELNATVEVRAYGI
jgi:hypothetical protein